MTKLPLCPDDPVVTLGSAAETESIMPRIGHGILVIQPTVGSESRVATGIGTASPMPLASGAVVDPFGSSAVIRHMEGLAPFRTIYGYSSKPPIAAALGPTDLGRAMGELVFAEAREWLPAVRERVRELMTLDPGWDTYSGAPTSVLWVLRALNFLMRVLPGAIPAPSIVPLSDGGLQLEWHRANIDVEVVFDADGAELYFRDRETGLEWEGDPEEGFETLGLAQRLGQGAHLQAS